MMDKIDAIEFEEMLMTFLYANENALAAAVWWHHPEFHKRFKKDELKEIINYLVRGIFNKRKGEQMTKTTIIQELAKITDNKELDVFEREIKYKQLINKIILSLD